jgi:nucleoside-diphosphate-sugar epimerase
MYDPKSSPKGAPMNFTSLHIIGCGDIGQRVARLASARQIKIHALSRGNKFPHDNATNGIDCQFCDLDDPCSLSGLDLSGSALLYSAPPPGGGIVDTRAANLLSAIKPGSEPVGIVYLSATSVYGDCGNETVTEERPAKPTNHTGMRRLDAEEQFRSFGRERDVPVVVLRVAGI